ncbi:Fatty acid hydroxylase family protein [Candida albicans]|uniref:Fatty acid hydroxylase family protein n=1 Tax=Candida albicans TaxID=5476 RepID=A0A8H6F191_CANAX|nr:Fatty acid hydroxylase family protein [Candida albicans]
MSTFKPPANFSRVLSQPTFYEKIIITEQPSLIKGIPDGILALIVPVVAYWSYSMFFHIIDVYELAEQYRIHPSEEEKSRNKVTLHEVVRDVIFQHIIQTIAGFAVYCIDPIPRSAFCIIDSWQFWLHRLMHINKSLYRRFHSRHHRLYVPYAFGALYNDPVEGFLLDTLGTGIASLVTGLSHRESIFLYTFATLKTVDDHCGYRLPFDIFQIIFPNNSVYHDIHHQMWGIKNNFSQPFFTFWDVLNNTQYKFVNEYKDLQKHITLTKYKEFLAKKSGSKSKSKQELEIEEEEKSIDKETKKEI